MLINEVCRQTALTKKAVAYYVEQGLVSPDVLENGYRDFSASNVETLNRIAVLRKLGIGTAAAKMVLCDETGNTLQRLAVEKELNAAREHLKQDLLDKLSCGAGYWEVATALKAIEQGATIAEKLLEAFPGYFGRFITLHYSRFLNEPIATCAQQRAYQEILTFLDEASAFSFPEDVQAYLVAGTKHLSAPKIKAMLEDVSQAYQNPDGFIAQNKELLEDYLAYKQSDTYKSLPACKMQSLLKEFYSTSGYYDVFIPAMKALSAGYASHYAQMEDANEKLLAQYPQIATLES